MQVNDLIPIASGFANLGIDVDSNAQNAFDITTLAPFNQIHLISGVYHDPIMGQSGVIRYSRRTAAFEVSVDGGLTFNSLVTGATTVTSVGVVGGANLTGDVDLAPTASGFIVIGDTGGASPIIFSVDQLGLSGLWGFPAQGFNGSVVNAITDFNGTSAQGIVNIVGASGIVADLIGQTLTITPGPSGGFTTMHVQAFAAATTWTVAHNLNTVNVVVNVYDNGNPAKLLIPDGVLLTNANSLSVKFNALQAGKVIVIGSRGI
jgi:hypothetical protein